jgi:hypothetical protein
MIDCTEILLSTNMNKFVTDKNYFAFIYALDEIDYYFVLFCFLQTPCKGLHKYRG